MGKAEECAYLSLPPALRLRSTPANPATLTSTSTTAWPLPAAPPPPSPRRPSAGPWTEHMIEVLPMDRYEEPELAGLVEIWAWSRRSSFQRRPSRRSRVRGYVVEVSSGIFADWVLIRKRVVLSEKRVCQAGSQSLFCVFCGLRLVRCILIEQ